MGSFPTLMYLDVLQSELIGSVMSIYGRVRDVNHRFFFAFTILPFHHNYVWHRIYLGVRRQFFSSQISNKE